MAATAPVAEAGSRMRVPAVRLIACLLAALPAATLAPGRRAENLAQQLVNPVASLVSEPFQLSRDRQVGPLDDGSRLTLDIQRMIPIGSR